MVEITIRGRKYSVTREEVLENMRGVSPGTVRSYSVVLDNRQYPIKQVVQVTLGIPPVAFTSMDAYRLLDKLGFEIESA